MKTLLSYSLMMLLLTGLPGCGGKKDPVDENKSSKSNVSKDKNSDNPEGSTPIASSDGKNWNDPSSYIIDGTVLVASGKPKQVWDFPMFQEILKDSGAKGNIEKDFDRDWGDDVPVKFMGISQFAVLIDSQLAETVAKRVEFEEKANEAFLGGKKEARKDDRPFEEIKKGREWKKKEETRKKIDKEREELKLTNRYTMPIAVLNLSSSVDQEKWRQHLTKSFSYGAKKKELLKKEHAGVSYEEIDGHVLFFAGDKTLILGGEALFKRVLAGKGSQSELAKKFAALNKDSDLRLVADLKTNRKLIDQLIKKGPMPPQAAMVLNLDFIALNAKATGTDGDSLLHLDTQTVQEGNATMIAGMLNGLLGMGKMQLENSPIGKDSVEALPKEHELKVLSPLAYSLVEGVKITSKEKHMLVDATLPKGYSKLPETLKPMLVKQREAMRRRIAMNNAKQIALAMHNYENKYRAFPRANGSGDGKQIGLSWRVHILPDIEEGYLYKQFHLDEAWDSPHNKKLIDKMPDIFKTEDMTEEGKTSIHVFTGKGAPFEIKKEKMTMISFKDGASNTILFVRAGADKADVWTKPGGLDFDPKNPIKAIGKTSGEGFLVSMADGSVFRLSKSISAKVLNLLIQHNDGEVIKPGEIKRVGFGRRTPRRDPHSDSKKYDIKGEKREFKKESSGKKVEFSEKK